jgi:hypothetical protein
MIPDILIVYDSTGFHLLHGHLHLAVMLGASGKASVDAKGHGPVLVSWSTNGLVVEADGNQLPLLAY